MAVFIEVLHLRALLLFLIPYLVRSKPTTFYVFDTSDRILKIASAVAGLFKSEVELLRFRHMELKDEAGMRIGMRVRYFDLAQVQADILSNADLAEQIADMPDWLKVFLGKRAAPQTMHDPGSLSRVLYLIQVVKWKLAKDDLGRARLFLGHRLWWRSILRYGAEHGVEVVVSRHVGHRFARVRFREQLGARNLARLRYAYRKLQYAYQKSLALFSLSKCAQVAPGVYLATESYGALCLDQPEYHSDLFFWQQSDLNPRNILLVFSAIDLLDDDKWKKLREKGISAVALNRSATLVREAPVYIPTKRVFCNFMPSSLPTRAVKSEVGRWLDKEAERYFGACGYWEDFFAQSRVKVYLTWYKHAAEHCAMADALKKIGGIMAVYQRSYEEIPNVGLAVGADIVFGFSKRHAEVERLSNSVIHYHVTTGYIGDHRFPMLYKKAAALRRQILAHGAERIVAFCDENTLADGRWERDHEFTQENYAFLLKKVLAEPWLGLVLKPKSPKTLRSRLGPVTGLLDRALATGRCHLYELGNIYSSHPPALAALSADLTIHEHLGAGTAAIESALAGTPTLLMDWDGWKVSDLYRLEVGKVVFTSWDAAWDACLCQWGGGGLPGFGDWSIVLDDLDPFRDGRAAERMGTYLRWLLDSLEIGDSREKALADAAERYCQAWGSDKIESVNVDPG
jgi:hypothetical protein